MTAPTVSVADQQVIGDAIDVLLLREVADGYSRSAVIDDLEATVIDHARGRCLTAPDGQCLAVKRALRIIAGEEM